MRLRNYQKLILIYAGAILLYIGADLLLHVPERISFYVMFTRLFSRNDIVLRLKKYYSSRYNPRKKKPPLTFRANKKIPLKTQRYDKAIIEKMLDIKKYVRNPWYLYDSVRLSNVNNMDHFFNSLLSNIITRGEKHVTADLFGDSLISGDIIPRCFREKMRVDFGNGGPGFICIRRPNSSYMHVDLKMRGSRWERETYLKRKLTSDYLGINGVSFVGKSGSYSEIQVYKEGLFSELRLHYLASVSSGSFRLILQTNSYRVSAYSVQPRAKFLHLKSDKLQDAVRVEVPNRRVKMYGIELLRKGGFVLNSFPFIGAEITKLLRIERDSWISQLKATKPDLVIMMFWGNKSTYSWLRDEEYGGDWGSVLDRVKTAVPKASVLIIGPMGVSRFRKGRLEVKPIIYDMIRLQKQEALKRGFAFLDLFEMSGGIDNIEIWYGRESKLLNPDRIHFSRSGSEKFCNALHESLLSAFHLYLMRKGYL